MVEVVRSMGIQEARDQLQELCGHVAASGERVVLSRRGQPVVEVRPVGGTPSASADPQPTRSGTHSDTDLLTSLQQCRALYGELSADLEIADWIPS